MTTLHARLLSEAAEAASCDPALAALLLEAADALRPVPRGRRADCERAWRYWAELRAAGWSYPQIGRHVGRDHSTIIHAVKRLAAMGAP